MEPCDVTTELEETRAQLAEAQGQVEKLRLKLHSVADRIDRILEETRDVSGFKLSSTSESRLKGVHKDLCRVVRRALELSEQDFSVLEGLRSPERQRELVDQGASKTLRSRHLTGHAVDLAPYHGRGISPWPSHHPGERERYTEAFNAVARSMFEAADELEVLVQWGSDWDLDGIPTPMDPDEDFTDMPHFQIPQHYRLEDAREAQRRRIRLRRMGEEVTS